MSAHSGKIQVLKPVAVVLVLAAALKLFVLDAVVVSGGSMEGTLLAGDFLLVDKTGYAPMAAVQHILTVLGDPFSLPPGTGVPSRGEVVAFTLPGSATRPAPASGAAADSDAIIIKRCVALPGDSLRLDGHTLRVNGVPVAVLDEPGEFFTGRAPDDYTVEEDHIFVLGDNLPASRDSRTWGFLPVERVIGRALFIYWSLGSAGSVRWDRVGTFVD